MLDIDHANRETKKMLSRKNRPAWGCGEGLSIDHLRNYSFGVSSFVAVMAHGTQRRVATSSLENCLASKNLVTDFVDGVLVKCHRAGIHVPGFLMDFTVRGNNRLPSQFLHLSMMPDGVTLILEPDDDSWPQSLHDFYGQLVYLYGEAKKMSLGNLIASMLTFTMNEADTEEVRECGFFLLAQFTNLFRKCLPYIVAASHEDPENMSPKDMKALMKKDLQLCT